MNGTAQKCDCASEGCVLCTLRCPGNTLKSETETLRRQLAEMENALAGMVPAAQLARAEAAAAAAAEAAAAATAAAKASEGRSGEAAEKEREAEQMRRQLEAHTKRIEGLQHELREARERIASSTQVATAAAQHSEALAVAEAENARLRRLSEATAAEKKRESSKLTELRQALATAEERNEHLRSEALGGTEAETARAQLANELRKLQAELTKSRQVAASATRSAEECKAGATALEAKLLAALSRAAELEIEVSTRQDQVRGLEAEIEELLAELRRRPAAPAAAGSRFGQFVHLKREVETLRAANDQLQLTQGPQQASMRTPRDATEWESGNTLHDPTFASHSVQVGVPSTREGGPPERRAGDRASRSKPFSSLAASTANSVAR